MLRAWRRSTIASQLCWDKQKSPPARVDLDKEVNREIVPKVRIQKER